MSARDISLDYTEDGKTLEAVEDGRRRQRQHDRRGEAAGRQIDGEIVDLTLAPDGTLTSAVLPARARTFVSSFRPAPIRRPEPSRRRRSTALVSRERG